MFTCILLEPFAQKTEIDGHNPRYDFEKTPWPKESGAFSFNIDPSPTKQFLRLRRNDAGTQRFAKLAFAKRPAEELYDLRLDPDQLQNVADEPEYAAEKERLRSLLLSKLTQSGDPRVAQQNAP